MKRILLATSLTIGALVATSLWAQELATIRETGEFPTRVQEKGVVIRSDESGTTIDRIDGTVYEKRVRRDGKPEIMRAPNVLGFAVSKEQSQLSEAIRAYQAAESDADKAAARQTVQTQLEEQYDQFLDQQENQIAELEKRIEELRGLLVRRRDAKSRMVELKLEMVISQAEGLGWPNANFEGAIRQLHVPAPPMPATTLRGLDFPFGVEGYPLDGKSDDGKGIK